MNSIEDRLRDAYRDAAQSVTQDTIRELGEPAVIIARPASTLGRTSPGRTMIPLAAAAAVALVAVLTAVVVPGLLAGSRQHDKPSGPSAASPAGRFLVAVSGRKDNTITIHNAITGASVATRSAPGHGRYFTDLATGDGIHYVAALSRPGICRTWLYQFQLNAAGHPGRLTPFRLASVDQALGPIAVSNDNSTLAFLGEQCTDPTGRTPSDLAVFDRTTLTTRHWNIPKQADVGSLSLTANGSLLGYNIQLTKLFPSAAYVLPTDAANGTAAQRSKVVARASRFGRDEIQYAALTPDGKTMYFTTNPTGRAFGTRWQLRAADLATGRIHVTGKFTGFPQVIAAGPDVAQALVVLTGWRGQPFPSASPTPTASAGRRTAPASPTPTASAGRRTAPASPTPTAASTRRAATTASPAPAGRSQPTPVLSRAPHTADPTPVPSATGTHTADPTPVPSPEPVAVELITLATGHVRHLLPGFIPLGTSFAW